MPAISIVLMATSHYHDLFLIDIQYIRSGPFLIDVLWELGPLFYVHIAYSYLLILAGMFILLREALLISRGYRGQAILLISGVFIPLLTNFAYTFHLIPQLKVNYDPLGFVLAGLIFAWALFRHRIFDIIPVARKMLFESMADGVIVVDRQSRIIDLNPAARDLLPEFEHSPIGEPLSVWLPEITNLEQHASGPVSSLELSLSHQGLNHVYDVRVSQIDGQIPESGRFYVFRDVTNRKQLETELKYLSITDPLTGVYNLRHFLDLGRVEVSKSHRHDEPFSIILADIDHFKKVNDQYGHLVGDQVLQSISQLFVKNIRIEDIFARYGGEEFILGLPKTNYDQAILLAERLRKSIEENTHQTDSGPIQLTISMGVATLNHQTNMALRRLIDRADQGLYIAKASGRNCVRSFMDQKTTG